MQTLYTLLPSFLAHPNGRANAVVRHPSFVHPSICKHLCKLVILPDKWLDRHQACTQCNRIWLLL